MDKEIAIRLGKKIKRLRVEAKMSTRDFADRVEISLSQLWEIETGKGNPTLKTLLAIATTLKTTVSDLIDHI
ncbi:helix-turn-helix domain-containing protein [Chitinophaga sp. sic0106]|uniref:helix-turn-helix domain-containing protein n=1 Tax=Chitinophaga sp. sic0106 TaxID=2854785 RepID=UPI001C462F3D|nr:helix-turn-helix transcriptional regulator [Chitinophaga sp. sic0106]MBV7531359.1 helix-turn-helix domain-containing protein [Chitinophaga sp. sic0106]